MGEIALVFEEEADVVQAVCSVALPCTREFCASLVITCWPSMYRRELLNCSYRRCTSRTQAHISFPSIR